MKTETKKLIRLLVLLGFLLSTCLYFAYGMPKQEENTQAITNNTPEQATIDTSTWETYTNETYGFSFKYPTLSDERLICPDSLDKTPIQSFYVSKEGRLVTLLDCKDTIFYIVVRDLDYEDYEYISTNWEETTFMGRLSYIKRYPERAEIVTKRDNYIYDISHTYDIEDSYIINTLKFE